MQLGAWQWVGEFEDYAAARARVRELIAADPKLHETDFEIQGKMMLN